MSTGEGDDTVKSKLNKFEHFWGARTRPGLGRSPFMVKKEVSEARSLGSQMNMFEQVQVVVTWGPPSPVDIMTVRHY